MASARFITDMVAVLSVLLFTRCFEHVTLIPVYLLTRQRDPYEPLWALSGPFVALSLPLSIFIFTEFMRAMPRELEGLRALTAAAQCRRSAGDLAAVKARVNMQ